MKYYFLILFAFILPFATSAQDLLFWKSNNSLNLNKTSTQNYNTTSIYPLSQSFPITCDLIINPIKKNLLIYKGGPIDILDFDGQVVQTLPFATNNFSCYFDLDVDSNIVYYLNRNTSQWQSYDINRSLSNQLFPRVLPNSIEIDEVNRKIFLNLFDGVNSRLISFDLPLMSSQQIIYTTPANQEITNFHLSSANNSIYFINKEINAIQKIDYNGANLETIIQESNNRIEFLEGEYCSNKIYYVTTEFTPTINSKIKRIEFDGGNKTILLDTNDTFISAFQAYFDTKKNSNRIDTSFCIGDSILYNYQLPDANYLWEDGSTLNTKSITQAGTYWVDIIYANCTYRDSIVVFTFDFTSASFLGDDTTICKGDSITLDIGLSNFSYLWDDGSTRSQRIIKNDGTYFAQLSDGGCSIRDSIMIKTKPKPSFTLGNDTTICQGEKISALNGSREYDYLWNTGSTDKTIIVNQSDKYVLTALLNGCSFSDTINVIVKPQPDVNLIKDTSICFADTLLLDATSSGATYSWDTGESSPSIQVNTTGNYKVIVSLNGCSKTDSTQVNIIDNSLLSIGNDTTLCLNSALTLGSNIKNSSYLWQNGSTNESIEVYSAGVYSLTITNSCGIKSDSISIALQDCACQIDVPNIFTPNQDFINDKFVISATCNLELFSIIIFNRWGEKVFESNQPNKSWDGTIDGRRVNYGTYYYVLSYKALNSANKTLKGSLLLSR